MLFFRHLLILFLIGPQLGSCGNIQGMGDSIVTKDFEFTSGNKQLSGIIDLPENGKARAMILFVHGSGPTDIRRENRYIDLRRKFIQLGIACALWDKPGNGRSEGQFDRNQPVAQSAQEVLDALAYLRSQNIPGARNIGIWSTSRGSWIAPIALSNDPDINFWISVSGVPAMDTKYYLMQANLPLDGYSREKTQLLLDEWVQGKKYS